LEELEGNLRAIAERVSAIVERLRRRDREAARAEQLAALGQLAAGLAHELRNPLMAIKILVQSTLAQGREGRLGGRDLQVLEDEIARLEELVRTFLDFARPPELSKARVDLPPILKRICELAAHQARLGQVAVHFEPRAKFAVVEADAAQLRQVFWNLLLNALEAAGGGNVWIELEAPTGRSGAGGFVAVRFLDDGPGLPPQLGADIFEPFVSTKSTGIGLGLTICRRIVQAHGGEIAARNRDVGGAQFEVRLPRFAAD
jgi:signal transduction histidine kinase